MSTSCRFLRLALCLLAAAFVLASSGARAQPLPNMSAFGQLLKPAETPSPEDRPWRLTADAMDYDQAADIVEAEGNVLLKSGDEYLKADFARYFRTSGWVFLRGNVEGRQGAHYVEAEEAEIDLVNEVGWLINGRIITEQPMLFLSGDRIRQTGRGTYEFDEATLTACEGGTPAWSMKFSEAKVTAEDEARLYHPRMKVLGVPVLYFPYLSVSTITKRKTGLLFPEFGSSTRLGAFYRQPIFVNINPENDVTLYENLYSRRGIMQGVEWRSTPDADSNLLLQGEWLWDREDGEPSDLDADALERPNEQRYWLRGKYDGHLPDARWRVKADVDLVSDQNYLREFDSGFMPFDVVNQTFLNTFGRDLQVESDLTRTSGVLLSREFEKTGLHIGASYTQNLNYMNGNRDPNKDPTVQALPDITAFAFRQALTDSAGPVLGLEWQGEASLGYLWRAYGDSAVRLNATPELSLPVALGPVSIIPSAGVNQTVWAVRKDPDLDSDADTLESRTVPVASVTAFTEFQRVYGLADPLKAELENAGQSVWTKLRHSIQPRLTYTYAADVNQGSLPNLDPDPDSRDRLEAASELRYGIENVFTFKRSSVALRRQDGNVLTPVQGENYREFLRIRLEHGYDFREAQRNDELDEFPRQPFSEVLAEVIAIPSQHLWLESRTYMSVYGDGIAEHEHGAIFVWPARGQVSVFFDFLSAAQRFDRRLENKLSNLKLSFSFNMLRDLVLFGRYERDLENEIMLERALGLTYRHHCFDLGFEYSDDGTDTSFAVRVNLLGLSSPSFSF